MKHLHGKVFIKENVPDMIFDPKFASDATGQANISNVSYSLPNKEHVLKPCLRSRPYWFESSLLM